MKNCNCIFMLFDDFVDLVTPLFSDTEEFSVDFDCVDGIYFCAVTNEEVYKRLAKHLGLTEISSIHTDHYDTTGVWIVTK